MLLETVDKPSQRGKGYKGTGSAPNCLATCQIA